MEKLLLQRQCVGVVVSYRGGLYTRISANIYNTRADYEKFITILESLWKELNLDLTPIPKPV